MYEVEYTDEFEKWWNSLLEEEQVSVAVSVGLLERLGTELKHPHSSRVLSSRYDHMRELRIQHKGKPYRVLYAFDPRRVSILLIGGNKTGDGRWYDKMIPIADKLYGEHLNLFLVACHGHFAHGVSKGERANALLLSPFTRVSRVGEIISG